MIPANRLAHVAVLAACVAVLDGCGDFSSSPSGEIPGYSVICVLSNVVAPTRVTVYPVVPADSSSTLVEGARVLISWPEGSATLTKSEVPNRLWGTTFSAYADTGRRVEVIPGRRFFLQALCPDGTEIGGHTTVPGDFRILAPRPGDTLLVVGGYVDLLVSWTPSYGGAGYVVEIACDAEGETSGRGRWGPRSYVVFDTTWVGRVSVAERYYGMFAVNVTAFDRHYFEHVFAGVPSAGVDNAFGVMAACWTRTATVFLVGAQAR
ncbi:MAG: hypothetical protein H5U38_14870 [Calditrichaeota bacterium]|nr:hypothetical protein [Calditrichota bacterium]